jgi:hypothetical protein
MLCYKKAVIHSPGLVPVEERRPNASDKSTGTDEQQDDHQQRLEVEQP